MCVCVCVCVCRQRHTESQTHRETDTQSERQRQTDRQMECPEDVDSEIKVYLAVPVGRMSSVYLCVVTESMIRNIGLRLTPLYCH